jgi:hypothetical protein
MPTFFTQSGDCPIAVCQRSGWARVSLGGVMLGKVAGVVDPLTEAD